MTTKQSVYKRLSEAEREVDKLYSQIEGLSAEQLHRQGSGWSVIQVISHLQMSEQGSLQYMQKKLQAGKDMPDSGTINQLKMSLMNLALDSPLRWKAPSMISNPSNEGSLEELKLSWTQIREEIKNYIDEYPDEFISKGVYKHPFAGRQNLESAIRFLGYHIKHHRHQIERIKKELHF